MRAFVHYGVVTGSHALVAGGGGALVVVLADHVRVAQHRVVSGGERVRLRNLARGWVSAEWASEEQDEGLRLVNLVVDPAAGLLDTEAAPLLLI